MEKYVHLPLLTIQFGGIRMSEKHSKISILLFSVTTVLLFGFSILISSQAFAGKEYKGKDGPEEWQRQREQGKEYRKSGEEMKRENLKRHSEQQLELKKYQREQKREALKHMKKQNIYGRRDYKERPAYRKHPGYRECPYDSHRHYEHHDYDGRRYEYHGHWKSWDQWNEYAKEHPDIYKHGKYYHENAHLMFRFCEPGTGNCVFFSIGR